MTRKQVKVHTPPNSSQESTIIEEPITPGQIQLPTPYYIDDDKIKEAVVALKEYIKRSKALKLSTDERKNLLEAGAEDSTGLAKVMMEVVFKNVPSNSKTYIHNVILPHHWRHKQEPEDMNVAIFVQHRRPNTEAEKIQFAKDRELDIENTHNYYLKLFDERLDKSLSSKISRIITTKELATEFNTFQKMDRLSKTYDLFLSDKQLMANKMNSLPRRLGRRFWVRERKIPLMVKLNSRRLDEHFHRAFSTEPFYVLGNSTTETIQLGIISQSDDELAENLKAFLKKLYDLYGDAVRFLRLRNTWGLGIPLFADLATFCPQTIMRKRRIKLKPVVDDFDMLEDDAKISVKPSGEVKVLKRKRLSEITATSTPELMKRSKRVKTSS